MQPHTRALIAASVYATISGRKVAGLYDHGAGEHLQIAAECRGDRLLGADGERATGFGGTLPEIYDDGDKAFVSMEVDGNKARGYDRGSDSHYAAEVTDRLIQLYDYREAAWFAFEAQPIDDVPGV